ncbi:hypothetical protein EB001_20360 [bacterium]|nr:hypothetical protein [bacterium]
MGFLSPKMPSLPPVQPLPEPPSTKLSAEEEKRIQEEQAAIQRRRKGRASTILTSPLTDTATTEKKTLLGM